MSSSSKQPVYFSIVAAVLMVSFSLSVILMAKSHVSFLQEEHKIQLAQTSNQTALQDIKLFAKQIKASFNYAQLNISTLEGEQVYSFNQTESNGSLSISAETLELALPERQLNIQYQLNINPFTSFVTNILLIGNLIIVVFSALFLFVAKISSTQALQATKAQANKQFITAINDIDSGNPIVLDDEVKDVLTKLKSKVDQTHKNQATLECVAYLDNLTQLPNRSRFVQFIEENHEAEKEGVQFGMLAITRCSELQTINQIHGYHEGDRYISHVAELIQGQLHSYNGAQVFRLNSSDFATIIPNITTGEAEKFAQQLTGKFNEYQLGSELDSVAFTGIVKFEITKPLGELLALADTAISMAQTLQKNAWYIQKDNSILASNSASFGNQNWRQEIDNVIENKKVRLLMQPIQPIGKTSKLYGEILARFMNEDQDVLPTAPFIAMAEKLDKIIAIDKLIIEKAIETINKHYATEHRFGINISARSIHDEHFLIWLERKLLKESAVSSRLVFEITEFGLQQNIKTGKRFIDMIHRSGAKVAVERFGIGLTSFKFFKDLKPDFIKMDGSYTRNIDEDKNNQYFLRLMVDLAHRISVKVLAESVETLEEKAVMDRLNVDGAQGYFIGKPEPL